MNILKLTEDLIFSKNIVIENHLTQNNANQLLQAFHSNDYNLLTSILAPNKKWPHADEVVT
ncbi:MAG: hypothetical protein P1U40_07405 [Coxiellaceae bacterium]|nr:hypothetical protein [Coxiellaceae bacterium]